jgi:anti-sigma regulatory factor (Ser/Thr protein kinase)
MMFCQRSIRVADASQVGEVRRYAQQIAAEASLGEDATGKASIVATELANNIVRYAPGGEVLLRSIVDAEGRGIEFLAIDRGAGMHDVSQCLTDGYSSGGTAGTGLGAVQRLSSEFDIFSASPGGTVVFSRISDEKRRSTAPKAFVWGAVNRPAPYEEVSGDTWRIAERASELVLLIADGLGHGPHAAAAADAAAATFDENPFLPLEEYFAVANRRMRATRGAAIAIAHLNAANGALQYAGVGNVAGSLRSRLELNGRGLMSHNGTVGAEMRKVESLRYECPEQPLLIMHSDGLQSRWSLEPYPGLIHRHPAVIAAVLYRDFCRGKDDVTVVAVRFSSPPVSNAQVA